ncbi:MAG: hypothetical protein JO147_00620, partial [Actinobacteria bacterium]|nr:hypothetical protein [Actinomycetota bacterium]
PASTNIAVLARAHYQQTLTVSTPFTFILNKSGRSATVPATLSATRAELVFWAPDNKTHPGSTSNAFLLLDISFSDNQGDTEVGFDPSLLTITPDGGAAIKAQNLSNEADKVLVGFEVPAGFTDGTVTLGGSFVDSSGITNAVAAPVSFPVAIPAG